MNFLEAMRIKHGKSTGGSMGEANQFFSGLGDRQFTEMGKQVSKAARPRKKIVKMGQHPPRSRYGNL